MCVCVCIQAVYVNTGSSFLASGVPVSSPPTPALNADKLDEAASAAGTPGSATQMEALLRSFDDPCQWRLPGGNSPLSYFAAHGNVKACNSILRSSSSDMLKSMHVRARACMLCCSSLSSSMLRLCYWYSTYWYVHQRIVWFGVLCSIGLFSHYCIVVFDRDHQSQCHVRCVCFEMQASAFLAPMYALHEYILTQPKPWPRGDDFSELLVSLAKLVPIDIRLPGGKGLTPLHILAYHGCVDGIKKVLAAPISVNLLYAQTDVQKLCVLHCVFVGVASESEKLLLLEALLPHHPDCALEDAWVSSIFQLFFIPGCFIAPCCCMTGSIGVIFCMQSRFRRLRHTDVKMYFRC